MASFSKKFVTSFLRDSVNVLPLSIVRLFPMGETLMAEGLKPSPYDNSLQEVKVVGEVSPYNTYTAINISSYTLEEQLIMYPDVSLSGSLSQSEGLEVVVVHSAPTRCPYTVINIE